MPEDDSQLLIASIPLLRRYARRLCQRNRQAAEDLVQDTLERAIRKFHLYRPGTHLRFWLYTIMRNIFFDQKRREKKIQNAFSARESDEIAAPRQFHAVAQQDLQRQLESLKPTYKELILMIGLEGASYDEASARTGVPVGTIRSRLFRARDELHNRIEGEKTRRR